MVCLLGGVCYSLIQVIYLSSLEHYGGSNGLSQS